MSKGEKKERRPPETQTQYFAAVVQADFPGQMDVMRWLMQDRQYLIVSALHDCDVYTSEEILQHEAKRLALDRGEKGEKVIAAIAAELVESGRGNVYTRTNGDGTQSQYRAGDVKPPHYHLLIKTRAKLRPSAVEKRFCGQLHFQSCSDRYEYARYLLHETFDSRAKYHYDTDALTFGGDVPEAARWYISMRDTEGDNTLNLVRRALECATMPDGSKATRYEMLKNVLSQQDSELLRSMMSHCHFYDNFVLAPIPSRYEGGWKNDKYYDCFW